MKELIEKIKTWVTGNPALAAVAALAASFLLLPIIRKATRPVRRKRRAIKVKPVIRRTTIRKPRRVKNVKKGLKPWQIKGSLAAKRRMAQIRKKR